MLARRLPGLLPPLDFDEALEVTTIHSVAGLLPPGAGLIDARPFRAPHHTCSDVALVGGGSDAAAGRDQPRAPRRAVPRRAAGVQPPRRSRRLRQPLEEGVVHIARAARSVGVSRARHARRGDEPVPVRLRRQPDARVPLHAGAPSSAISRRLSGPLRDRFDLRLDLPAVPWADLAARGRAESNRARRPRARVAARARQLARQGVLNARPGRPAAASRLPPGRRDGPIAAAQRGAAQLRLSVRGRVARTAGGADDRRSGRGRRRRRRRTWQRPCSSDLASRAPTVIDYEIW